MTTLVRKRTVYDQNEFLDTKDSITFTVDDDGNEISRAITLAYQDWMDMGWPKTVTVTIEPGDRLN